MIKEEIKRLQMELDDVNENIRSKEKEIMELEHDIEISKKIARTIEEIISRLEDKLYD